MEARLAILIDGWSAGPDNRSVSSRPAQLALVSRFAGQMVSWRPPDNGPRVSRLLAVLLAYYATRRTDLRSCWSLFGACWRNWWRNRAVSATSSIIAWSAEWRNVLDDNAIVTQDAVRRRAVIGFVSDCLDACPPAVHIPTTVLFSWLLSQLLWFNAYSRLVANSLFSFSISFIY